MDCSPARHINFPVSAATRRSYPVLITPCYQLHSGLKGSIPGVWSGRELLVILSEWVILPHPIEVGNLSITRSHTCRILTAFLLRIGRTFTRSASKILSCESFSETSGQFISPAHLPRIATNLSKIVAGILDVGVHIFFVQVMAPV